MITTLQAFTTEEQELATDNLSAKVATMIGRKMEEADWDFVYCNAKNIPVTDWSNLSIDINHDGLGVEHKMLRIKNPGSILDVCGTSRMHPSGTRSIRIPDEKDPDKAMKSILNQYGKVIDDRTKTVKQHSTSGNADMRFGWLLWKEELDEFLYFEEAMLKPNYTDYYAQWNKTPARGSRKPSRSLWIYEKSTEQKKYSVTTEAGAKIQPYFDVPGPKDPNLYHFKVQGVCVDGGLIKVWITKSTAQSLELIIGSLETGELSQAIDNFTPTSPVGNNKSSPAEEIARCVIVNESSYRKLEGMFNPISDEYMFQQLATALNRT
jgi:hypothetical protein